MPPDYLGLSNRLGHPFHWWWAASKQIQMILRESSYLLKKIPPYFLDHLVSCDHESLINRENYSAMFLAFIWTPSFWSLPKASQWVDLQAVTSAQAGPHFTYNTMHWVSEFKSGSLQLSIKILFLWRQCFISLAKQYKGSKCVKVFYILWRH